MINQKEAGILALVDAASKLVPLKVNSEMEQSNDKSTMIVSDMSDQSDNESQYQASRQGSRRPSLDENTDKSYFGNDKKRRKVGQHEPKFTTVPSMKKILLKKGQSLRSSDAVLVNRPSLEQQRRNDAILAEFVRQEKNYNRRNNKVADEHTSNNRSNSFAVRTMHHFPKNSSFGLPVLSQADVDSATKLVVREAIAALQRDQRMRLQQRQNTIVQTTLPVRRRNPSLGMIPPVRPLSNAIVNENKRAALMSILLRAERTRRGAARSNSTPFNSAHRTQQQDQRNFYDQMCQPTLPLKRAASDHTYFSTSR